MTSIRSCYLARIGQWTHLKSSMNISIKVKQHYINFFYINLSKTSFCTAWMYQRRLCVSMRVMYECFKYVCCFFKGIFPFGYILTSVAFCHRGFWNLIGYKDQLNKYATAKISIDKNMQSLEGVMLCYVMNFYPGSPLQFSRWTVINEGPCVGSLSAFNSTFGHRSRSHNICPPDNHLSGLSISLSSLVLSWLYRLPFFKSLVWLGCDSNSQPSVLVASALPLHYHWLSLI